MKAPAAIPTIRTLMQFKIKKAEERTAKSGSKYHIATLVNEQGNEYENTTIFSSVPGDKTEGAMIEGTLAPNDYNGKKGWKLEAEKKPVTRSTAGIAIAQERKAGLIKEAQENKEYGIKVSSTARDATLILVAMMQKSPMESSQIKSTWLHIRSWLWANWDMQEDTLPPDTF